MKCDEYVLLVSDSGDYAITEVWDVEDFIERQGDIESRWREVERGTLNECIERRDDALMEA